jgi:class 3 adenylate cyclase
MPRLDARRRASLPNRAFAYIDSRGRRRLPLHDKAHVRNALARFNQVVFDDDQARERARRRVLNAARKYGIVPVGFVTGQLRAERDRALGGIQAAATHAAALPAGFVTFLMSDIEGSTELLQVLGDRYRDVLDAVRTVFRAAASRAGGREVDVRADESFVVFDRAAGAVRAAVGIQRALGEARWPEGVTVRVRIGIHSGRPTLTDMGYIGLPVHTAARVCAAAHGGQILASGQTREAVAESPPPGIRFRSLGRHRLPGLVRTEALFQVEADGLPANFPPPRMAPRARRRAEPSPPPVAGMTPAQMTIL